MNVVQDPSKKGSINSLLNPQDVSSFPSLPSGPLAPNHTHAQSHTAYYAPEYSPAGSFHLRAASWESSDDPARRKALASGSMPRYPPQLNQLQPPQMHSQSSTSNYAYATSSGTMRDRVEGSQEYAGDGRMWQPHTSSQHDSMNMSYGRSIAPTFSDERTALSGGYHSSSINYPSGYDSQSDSGAGAPQQWQTAERASVRLVARGLSAQPTSSAQDERYTPIGYYQQPRYDASMAQQSIHQRQQMDAAISSSNSQNPESTRPSASTSSKRSHPDSEGNPAPKTKRPRAKGKATGSESSASTPIGTSKRGYNAKKRSEAAFISAQNELLRAQREGSQGHAQGTSSDSQSPSNPPTGDNGGAEQIYMPELQFARCMSNRYRKEEFPRCVSCTRRWAGDTCRFQGIRFFMRDGNKKLVGISFQEHPTVGPAPVMEFPSQWNRRFEREHAKRSKLSIAKALLPILRAEQDHIKSSEIVRRPRECDVRVTCDTCMTSLFSTSFMCRLCGREVCNECFQQVVDLTQTPTNPAEHAAFMARRERHAHANPFFLACLKRKDHGVTEFTPVTRFVEVELDQAINDMRAILEKEEDVLPFVDYSALEPPNGPAKAIPPSTNQTYPAPEAGPSQDGLIGSHSLQEQSSSDVRTELPPTTLYSADTFPDPLTSPIYDDYTPSNVPEHITSIPIYRLQIIPASLYDPPQSTPPYSSKPPLTFSSLWVKGTPLLVKDVLPRFKIGWTPQYFMDRYGDQTCIIVESQTDENKRINIREFFSQFGDYKDRQGCWKLKDWPPTAEFKTAFPELFEDFSQAVPVPDYVRRDGVYNIGSHFPLNAIGPDLGPKMYNALASSQEVGSKGSTRLHMDMADALNVMLSATLCEDGTEGYAVWDLFRAEDSDKIRMFLKKKFGYGANGSTGSSSGGKKNANANANGANGTAAAGSGGNAGEKTRATHAVPPVQMIGHDPIHGQQFYLDVELRRQLFEEYSVKSYRIYQRPGDGVFIPAGCAHQVANMADCMKIAIDFVSPENVDRCEKLTKEFREQNQSKVWKEDVLQLRTMMWFAWQSCTKMERALDGVVMESSVPPLDTDRSLRR